MWSQSSIHSKCRTLWPANEAQNQTLTHCRPQHFQDVAVGSERSNTGDGEVLKECQCLQDKSIMGRYRAMMVTIQ